VNLILVPNYGKYSTQQKYQYKKSLESRSGCILGTVCPRYCVSHCNECVKFEFNDKSLHTKSIMRGDTSIPKDFNLYYY